MAFVCLFSLFYVNFGIKRHWWSSASEWDHHIQSKTLSKIYGDDWVVERPQSSSVVIDRSAGSNQVNQQDSARGQQAVPLTTSEKCRMFWSGFYRLVTDQVRISLWQQYWVRPKIKAFLCVFLVLSAVGPMICGPLGTSGLQPGVLFFWSYQWYVCRVIMTSLLGEMACSRLSQRPCYCGYS